MLVGHLRFLKIGFAFCLFPHSTFFFWLDGEARLCHSWRFCSFHRALSFSRLRCPLSSRGAIAKPTKLDQIQALFFF